MKKLITKEFVNQIQFFQLPKEFFQDPQYIPMKLESKVAYTVLLDLLPLSIQNNWVNENNEVFVKLSRKKLMALLGIKGTQKAANIMKELVDHELIVNKRKGLTQCNEIYLYPLEKQLSTKKAPKDPKPKNSIPTKQEPVEAKESSQPNEAPIVKPSIASNAPLTPKTTAFNIPAPPVLPTQNLGIDLAEIDDLLKNQIHTEDLKIRYKPAVIDEICNNIREMFLSTSTRIGDQDKPMVIMRSVIRKLQMHHIEHVMDRFIEVTATTQIRNPKRYIQTMIYNSVHEASTAMFGDIRYTFGYY